MKITKSQLKEIIKEELGETLGHQASQRLAAAGIAHESEKVRKEIMDMILALDTGDEQDAETLAHMAAYLKDASAVNVRQGLGLEEKKDHPGETCKQAHPDESHEEWEKPPMKLSTPKIDPTSTSPKSRRFRRKGQVSETFGAYMGAGGGAMTGNLGAVAGRSHPTTDDSDSIIQTGAVEFFMDLGLNQKVSEVLAQNVASRDLVTVMDLIPKIDTAREGETELQEDT